MNESFLAQPKFSRLTPKKCCIVSFEICENIHLVIFTNIHFIGQFLPMIYKIINEKNCILDLDPESARASDEFNEE